MDVSVYKARAEISVFSLDDLLGLIVPETEKNAVIDRDVSRMDFTGEHIDQPAVFDEQIRRQLPPGGLDPVFHGHRCSGFQA